MTPGERYVIGRFECKLLCIIPIACAQTPSDFFHLLAWNTVERWEDRDGGSVVISCSPSPRPRSRRESGDPHPQPLSRWEKGEQQRALRHASR